MQVHEDSTQFAAKRTPWNKGKLIGAKPPPSAQTRVVDPDQAPDRRANPGLGTVQSGHRQQAAGMRCHRP